MPAAGWTTMTATALAAAAFLVPASASAKFVATGDKAVISAEARVIDSRPAELCAKSAPKSAVGPALCLSLGEVTGPHGRLASFRDIAWKLGALGLTGGEIVIVVGDRVRDRDAIAGLLYLAGQQTVVVWDRPLGDLPFAETGPGQSAEMTRTAVYTAPMRDGAVILASELATRLEDGGILVLDGRTEAEYWGETVRSKDHPLGGHIAGAQSMPFSRLAAGETLPIPDATIPVVYGHGPAAGLAMLTDITARRGRDAIVYLEGYGEWAASGRPRDAATAPRPALPAPDERPVKVDRGLIAVAGLAGTLFGVLATAIAFSLGRKRRI